MIKLVIQIADVHIHNLHRHEEYAEQFDKLINKCKELTSKYKKDEVRILICGDLVHQKNDISNELIVFSSAFLRQLSDICQVLIYSGNHDLLVNNKSRTDTLTGIFETAMFDNVFYFDMATDYKSACIVDDGITWALFSIHDRFSRPDIDSAIMECPTNTIVGLYHGTVKGAQLFNGYVADSGMDGELFEGCDIVMAGDIHKYQVIKRGDVEIVYPGSLIQQNYGETVTQHGFVVWDMENKTHEFVELPSAYGYYNYEISQLSDIDNNAEKLINY